MSAGTPPESGNREIRDLFPYIDVLFMNETEAEHYGRKESAEEAAREFARTAGMAVIKMGKKGSIAVKDGTLYQAAPYTVEAVDTTGAEIPLMPVSSMVSCGAKPWKNV